MKTFTFLLFVLFLNLGYAQSDKITIKTDHLEEANYLKMDDFYLTHYLYIDLFLRENLFPDATPEEVSSILTALKTYVSVDNKLDIEIEKPGKNNYLIRFVILKKEDGTELLIAFTNWTANKKKFEKEIKTSNDSYTRWYFLNGDKMTYRKDMSSENDYLSMNKSDLANAFLFDELADNDSEVSSSIEEYLKQDGLSVSDQIMANLILLKYQIFQKENLDTQIAYLEDLFEKNKSNSNLRGLQAAFTATEFQIKLSR